MFLKKFKFLFIFFLISNYFFYIFSNYFDAIISKIFIKKKKHYPTLQMTMPTPLLSWLKTQPSEYEHICCFPDEARAQKSKIKTPQKKRRRVSNF
jgi:hypothetical protein